MMTQPEVLQAQTFPVLEQVAMGDEKTRGPRLNASKPSGGSRIFAFRKNSGESDDVAAGPALPNFSLIIRIRFHIKDSVKTEITDNIGDVKLFGCNSAQIALL
jgi:hypothetical protein